MPTWLFWMNRAMCGKPGTAGGPRIRKSEYPMARPEPLRAGLIGYGIGKVYAAALRSAEMYYAGLPRVKLVAVATSGDASGQLAVEQAGFERYTTNYRELLESPDLDLVVIAT